METYHGYVRTRHDAVKLFEACRLGLLSRVQRRLSEKERQSIRSGSVFVWDEREAGIRRWTDGKSWSAGRVSGGFLKYKEMEGKRGSGFGDCTRCANRTSDWRRNGNENHNTHDHDSEEYRYKGAGLMQQHFSSTTPSGQHLHLISYYCRSWHGQPHLSQPSADPSLRDVVLPKSMYPAPSTRDFDHTPALVRTPMQQPCIVSSHYSHSQQLHLRHQEPYTPHLAQPGCGCGLCVSLAATLSHRRYATDPYSQPQRVQPHEIAQPRSAVLAPVYLNSHYKHSTPYEHELSSLKTRNLLRSTRVTTNRVGHHRQNCKTCRHQRTQPQTIRAFAPGPPVAMAGWARFRGRPRAICRRANGICHQT